MIIQHNLLAINNMNVGKQLNINTSKITEKLSSGYQINRVGDDAANLAISEKMNAKIRALNRSQNNIEEGISLVQVAGGALQEVSNMLTRIHELCVQAANGTNTEDDRSKISEEIGQIYDEMNRIFESTEYNTMFVFKNNGGGNAKDRYSYTETITTLPVGQYSEFGEMTEVETKWFELATEAKGASVTLTLDSDVDLNDASTLDGKSFYMEFQYQTNGKTYNSKVRFSCDKNAGAVNGPTENGISTLFVGCIDSRYTVQEAFNSICTRSENAYIFKNIDFKSVTVSTVNGKNLVTFQIDPHDLEQNFNIDGNQIIYSALNGNGIISNEFKIYSIEEKGLQQIDSSDNTIKYGKDAYARWLVPANDKITEGQKRALLGSYLELNINGSKTQVEFTVDETNALNTREDLLSLLKDKLESLGCNVIIDGSYLNININDCVDEKKEDSIVHIREIKKDNTEENGNIISILTYESIKPTAEQAGEWIVELPVNGNGINMPFSLNIGGRECIFYEKGEGVLTVTQ